MKVSHRDQTILGMGLAICGALLLLSGTISDGVGLAIGIIGIAVLGNRPGKRTEANTEDDG